MQKFEKKKIKAITVKTLVQSPEKFSSVIWSLVIKTLRIRNVSFIFQNFEAVKKSAKIHMGSKKFI